MPKLWMMVFVLVLWTGVGTSFSQEAAEPVLTGTLQAPGPLSPTMTQSQQELYKELQLWYDRSLEIGEKGKQWVMEDLQNIGDWEYQIITLNPEDEEKLTEQLNMLGKGRWEVFWVQEKMQGTRFFLKRPVRTYLKHIPAADLLRAIPKGEGQ